MATKQDFLKRRSFAEGKALLDVAHLTTQRLYCDALRFWRSCAERPCKRHRRCVGDPSNCLLRGSIFTPPSLRLRARKLVIDGGPRHEPPASHAEWQVRRSTFQEVATWRFG